MGVYVDINSGLRESRLCLKTPFSTQRGSQIEFSDRASGGQGELFDQRRNIYAYDRGRKLIGFSYLQGGGMDYNLGVIQPMDQITAIIAILGC